MDNIYKIASLYEEIMLLEFSEAAIKKFITKFQKEASEEQIRETIKNFEKYKNTFSQKDPLQYKSFGELEQVVNAAKSKGEYKNKKITKSTNNVVTSDDILAEDENVVIYKADTQDKCILYGQKQFCISRQATGNMFSNYRLENASTFYFIYFKNKPETALDHVMVLNHHANGYSWTFSDNKTSQVKGGWKTIVKRYPELKKYKNIFVNKPLSDDEISYFDKLEDFSFSPSMKKFKELPYKMKADALKTTTSIPDDIWLMLDSVLRREFLNIGPNLTPYQADDLKPNEIERYKIVRRRSIPELLEDDIYTRNKHDSFDMITSNPEASYYYASNLDWEDVPKEIMDSIMSVKELAADVPEYVTIKESKKRILLDELYFETISDFLNR
jgi:hypothetical protein